MREEKLKRPATSTASRVTSIRYLKSFLERDKTIDLSVVLQSSDTEYSEQDRVALPTMPAAKEGKDGLFSYDVVILGDVDTQVAQRHPDGATSPSSSPRRGAGVLFIAGENFNPLTLQGLAARTRSCPSCWPRPATRWPWPGRSPASGRR